MDDFNLEKLAKEIVLDRLKDLPDAPAGAGLAALQILTQAVTATQARQAPRDTVVAVCRGLMSGMLLLGKDLPAAAVAILKQVNVVAETTQQDPAELMTWAIEGIAPVAKLAGLQTRYAVQEAIEASFMGAGQVFASTCETAGA
ncbi:MAG: hypothetical protein HYV14_11510 [Elusimicrobia bacterium]|nr:hypothetical protein [Elusimicrobiota bacterium]